VTSKSKPPSLTRLALAVEGEGLGPKDLHFTGGFLGLDNVGVFDRV